MNNEAIFLTPVFKQTIWGGRKLASEFGYEIPEGPVGECWAISAHPHGDCEVAGGTYAGSTLSQLWDEHRELFGCLEGDRFPLLVKIIDAEDDLSVQVHPGDDYAREHENGSLGKHECWYVLATHPHGHIVVGQKAHDREAFARLAAEKRWDELVNEIPIWDGDFFDIPPGTLHAILGGTLIIETQQSSDITYRVYDYERVQPDGTLRETHLEKALDVIDYDAVPQSSGEVLVPEIAGETQLVETSDFCVARIHVHGYKQLNHSWPFVCSSVIEGSGELEMGDRRYQITKGSHFILPSNCGPITIFGDLCMICSHV